jgi:hypothetical protein
MAIGRLTNEGRAMRERLVWNQTSLGLENNGSAQPSYWAVLLNNQAPELFTALNNGPLPGLGTYAQLIATYPQSVILPTANYNEHDIPLGTFSVTVLDGQNLVDVSFVTGQEPLLTVINAAGIGGTGGNQIAGWAMMSASAPIAATRIMGIFPSNNLLGNVPQNHKIRIRDLHVFSQSA